MTLEQLQEILSLPVPEQIKAFEKGSGNVPKWDDLEKQYNPLKHRIFDTTDYPPKLNANGIDEFKRTALGLQKLAVNRVAQSMFSTPVNRIYSYDTDNETLTEAVAILETVYKNKNNIDASNIERAKMVNASCQCATVWSVEERESTIGLEKSKFTLHHYNYSEMEGYKIHPIKDSFGNLLVLSIYSKDENDDEFFISYINTPAPVVIQYKKLKEWAVDEGFPKALAPFPVVYLSTPEPIWGGEAGTNLVEQLEEMESFEGLYIKRNSAPTFTLDYGEIPPGSKKSTTVETSEDARKIIQVGKGGNMQDVSWRGASESVDKRYQRLRNAFFEQVQIPDTSFANMLKSNTSAENKELIFADARAKAEDLGGEWEVFFSKELDLVKEIVKIMFPSFSTALDEIQVRSVISPYNVRTKKDNADYVSLAGDSMSLSTKVRVLNEVDDITAEVDAILEQKSTASNFGY